MPPDPRYSPSFLSAEDAAPVTSFVSSAPNSTYVLNERETGVPLVELCRAAQGGQGKSCIEVQQAMTKVFALMQAQGFFCTLPSDPSHTEIECQRIEKLVQRQTPK
ncbi:hypothetical protein BCR35DRAFT_222782 [Leucosporidium creatinivorum]|uniref:Uncharacterized protein n=1 Tax=Leucosporidium creatinivorum TaxID=106004 RepID=A0A1Y2D7B0_9BASI|nr:hypothetical protein BCR35DRAFT_222782 [Leucosporidium creatinivorum]